MSASTIDFVKATEEELASRDCSVSRSAFYLKGQGQPVFAWLHQHSMHRNVDHGVIICPPIGYEQVHSHRSLRHLADKLATEMVPTLRFDWHGTGDSPGIDEDPHRYQTWLTNISDAVRWMREQLGCRQISLIGLRLGGTLATLATADNEIDNLVLWSPLMKGRAYVREMKALSLTSESAARRPSADSNDIEAAGFVLSSETATDLSQIDLLKSRPHCGRALVVSRAEMPDDDRLCNHWNALGVRVEQVATHGFSEMMAEPHRSEVPHDAIHQIAEWLTNAINVDAESLVTNDEAVRLTSISMSKPMLTSNSNHSQNQIRESTFTICNQPNLFGIVSEPNQFGDVSLPMVVLLNAGSTHRIGPNRLNVLIARRLAAEGFRCLRMDLSGLGDSISESADCENDPYPATAFRDIEFTLKQLEQQFGVKRVVLMGLCSGAYAAFQSAAQISNPALVESVLINPLTYFWNEGMTLDDSPTTHLRLFHYCQSVALDPRKWLKLLSGQSKIGITGAIALLARQLKVLRIPDTSPSVIISDPRGLGGVSHPQKEDLQGDLRRIVHAGRKLAMFFAKSDPGFSILNFHAKWKANRLRAAGQLTIKFIDDADHTFSTRAARTDLIDGLAIYLGKQYPSLARNEFIKIH